MTEVMENLLVQLVVGLMILGGLSAVLGYLMRTVSLHRRQRHRRGRRRRFFPSILPRRRSRMTLALQLQYIGCGVVVLVGFILVVLIFAWQAKILP